MIDFAGIGSSNDRVTNTEVLMKSGVTGITGTGLNGGHIRGKTRKHRELRLLYNMSPMTWNHS